MAGFQHAVYGLQNMHRLIDVLTTSRVRVAGPQRGRRGMMRSEEGERSVVVGMLRRKLSAASVKAQTSSLLGRLEGLGPGWEAAAGRRREALEKCPCTNGHLHDFARQ